MVRLPTLASSLIPAPQGWDEFEQIVLTSLKIKWTSPNLTRHGRQGQSQDGVDIYGEDDLGRLVGIQCKLTTNDIDVDTIKTEISKAEGFQPELCAFYIATNLPTDAKIQREVRLLSQSRLNQNKFPIGIFFWQDIIQDLLVNEAEFKKHYPQIQVSSVPEQVMGTRLLAGLDVAYFGYYLKDYMGLLFGEFSDDEELLQIERLCLTIESCSTILMDSVQAAQVVSTVTDFKQYVIPWILEGEERPEGWRIPNQYATSIESHIESLVYKLGVKERAVFSVGKLLGGWYFDEIKPDFLFNADAYLYALIGQITNNNEIVDKIREVLSEYYKSDNFKRTQAPSRIYSIIRRAILSREIDN